MADNSSTPRTETPRGFEALKAHVIANKIDVALWLTRVFTLIFCLGYFIPIFKYVPFFYMLSFKMVRLLIFVNGFVFSNPSNSYYKALMSSAATSALRLHQRLPRVALTREFLSELMMEDSCHYLMFSVIFLYATPITCILLISNCIRRIIRNLSINHDYDDKFKPCIYNY